MVKKGLKGHIALWLLGRYSNDPRVHDFLNSMMYYSGGRLGIHLVVRHQFGLGRMAGAILRAPFGMGKHLAPSVYHVETTQPGQFPRSFEEVQKVRARPGPVTAGTRAAAARGSSMLMAGFLVYSLRPSFEFFRTDEVIS